MSKRFLVISFITVGVLALATGLYLDNLLLSIFGPSF